MKDEALRLALEALENAEYGDYDKKELDQAITAIKAALEAKDEPVGRLQEPTVERAWFTIAELNAWADKKLLENPQWVMPKDEPERDEPPPQRTWVGLTELEQAEIVNLKWWDWEDTFDIDGFVRAIEAKLKERNA